MTGRTGHRLPPEVTDGGTELVLARMLAERRGRLQAEVERRGLDALVLLGTSAVDYATGFKAPVADEATATAFRTVAVLPSGDPHPHLFTPYPQLAPPRLPSDHVHEPLWLDDGSAIAEAVECIADVVTPGPSTVGVDQMTGALFAHLTRAEGALSGAAIVDAGRVLSAARVCKTEDELECIRRAQRINELAMLEVEPAARPGARQSELSAVFLRQVVELGADGWAIDPIWQVMPTCSRPSSATVHEDLAFPLTSTDRVLRDGDVVWVDTGVSYEGYASDFGRTWPITLTGKPTPAQHSCFSQWHDIFDAALEITRPGATGADLADAARRAAGGSTPWLAHFYLAHGIGLDSAEAPLVGTDLGPEADQALTLAPGMVLVFEPEIWDERSGGYRAEEIVAITEDGYRMLSGHHDWPF